MRVLWIVVLAICASGCTYDLELSFERNGKALDIKFHRRIFGIKTAFEMNCLAGITATRLRDRHIVWRMQRNSSACYSGDHIKYGQNVSGYSNYVEPLEPGNAYVFSVFGSGASGSEQLVIPIGLR